MILKEQVLKLREKNKVLKRERDMYKKAYFILSCYFDSISDKEQEKVAKKLERIFKVKLK